MTDTSEDRSNTAWSLDAVIVSQPVDYGVAVHVRQLTEAALAAGHRVTVVSPGSAQGPLADWVEDAGARHVTLDMTRSPALRDPFQVLAIRRLVRGRDVVHLHSSKASALGRVAVVFTPHSWSWLVGGRLARLYRGIERMLARRADAIVSVSEGEAAEGRVVLGAAAPVILLPNGVDLDRFSPDGARAGRDTGSGLIVCVGRLSEQKGQDLAIRSLALLRDGTALLRFVGEESSAGEKDRLDALAGSLKVADRIEWQGLVDDTAPEYRAADVVIAPSRWEGMSLAFLEALACGATIVATDVSGSEALGDAAVIVPQEDPAALADAIDALLRDPGRRRALGRRAREQSRHYDLASTMRANLALWAELAGRGRVDPRSPVGAPSIGGTQDG